MNPSSRRDFLKVMGMSTSALLVPHLVYSQKKHRQPLNVICILIDDLGWTDFGCYGSSFYDTPNIDNLASEGMMFTNAYAASPVCSPTRASIMSGKHPARINITQWIGGTEATTDETEIKNQKLIPPDYEHQLALSEVTVGEAFKENGYNTFFAGKWHLGDNADYFPDQQGFDINKGGCGWGSPKNGHFSPYNIPTLDNGPNNEYLTDRLTDETLTFIDDNADKPFFAFLSHYAVHMPIQAKSALVKKYEDKAAALPSHETTKNIDGVNTCIAQDHLPTYGAMVEHVDESVGRIMDKLKELNIEDNTLVMLTSDNGGLSTIYLMTSNLPLRYGKGWCYEGGIREPLIVRLPAVIEAGSTCDEPVTSCDLYPTMLAMAGLPLKPEQHKDGVSLVPLLKQTGSINRDALYWHYPHYHGGGHKPSGAIRVGDYKLIEFFEDNNCKLFNLKDDIEEENDLAKQMPAKVNELRNKMYAWRKEVDARMPKDWVTSAQASNGVPGGPGLTVQPIPATGGNYMISYNLPTASKVTLKVYTTNGREVKTLVDTYRHRGKNCIVWKGQDNKGRNLSVGTYILKFEACHNNVNKKLILTR